jgi:hypothetical protein
LSDKSIDLTPTFYVEDILTSNKGSVIIGHPTIVWTLIFALETTGTAIISFSDDADGYNPLHRIGKEIVVGPQTDWNGFGKGLTCKRGFSMISNLVSVDVWGVAE